MPNIFGFPLGTALCPESRVWPCDLLWPMEHEWKCLVPLQGGSFKSQCVLYHPSFILLSDWCVRTTESKPCLDKRHGQEMRCCSVTPHSRVYFHFSYCSNYRFMGSCKNTTGRGQCPGPFTQFSPMVLSYITIKCYFKSLKFLGYLKNKIRC